MVERTSCLVQSLPFQRKEIVTHPHIGAVRPKEDRDDGRKEIKAHTQRKQRSCDKTFTENGRTEECRRDQQRRFSGEFEESGEEEVCVGHFK